MAVAAKKTKTAPKLLKVTAPQSTIDRVQLLLEEAGVGVEELHTTEGLSIVKALRIPEDDLGTFHKVLDDL